MQRPQWEVANLIRVAGQSFIEQNSHWLTAQHLKVLREAGLVSRRAEGRQRIYSLRPGRLRVVAEWTAGYRKFWESRLSRLGDYLDAKK